MRVDDDFLASGRFSLGIDRKIDFRSLVIADKRIVFGIVLFNSKNLDAFRVHGALAIVGRVTPKDIVVAAARP